MAGSIEAGEEAEYRIAFAAATGDPGLSLAGLGLESLPSSLRALTALRTLDLSGNLLAGLPPWLGELAALEELDLRGNRLVALPESLTGLHRLTRIDLADNQFVEIPRWLGRLDLAALELADNRCLLIPPPQVVAEGTGSVLAHLRRLDAQAGHRRTIILGLTDTGSTLGLPNTRHRSERARTRDWAGTWDRGYLRARTWAHTSARTWVGTCVRVGTAAWESVRAGGAAWANRAVRAGAVAWESVRAVWADRAEWASRIGRIRRASRWIPALVALPRLRLAAIGGATVLLVALAFAVAPSGHSSATAVGTSSMLATASPKASTAPLAPSRPKSPAPNRASDTATAPASIQPSTPSASLTSAPSAAPSTDTPTLIAMPPTVPTSLAPPGPIVTGLIIAADGLCMDDANARTANNSQVDVVACDDSDAQTWTVVPAGNSIQIFGKCLDLQGGGTARGTNVVLYDCDQSASQQFIPQIGDELYNPWSGKCLEDPAGLAQARAALRISDCTGGVGQLWILPV